MLSPAAFNQPVVVSQIAPTVNLQVGKGGLPTLKLYGPLNLAFTIQG
jgi:hypothetical protein